MTNTKLPAHIAFALAAQEGAAQGQLVLWRFRKTINRVRAALVLVLSGMFAYSSLASAALASTPISTSNCNGINGILGLVNQICTFLLAVAGATSLLMFAIAGCLYIFGGTPQRAAKGMEIIRQTVIGLAVLAGAGLLKFLILAFAPSNEHGTSTTCQAAS